jgi:hypothetical protein
LKRNVGPYFEFGADLVSISSTFYTQFFLYGSALRSNS